MPIMKLKAALEASLKIMLGIINLSSGTSNIYEKDLLDPIIDDIVREEIIVIASYNNQNIFTYPSVHKDVFGVISDKTDKLAS